MGIKLSELEEGSQIVLNISNKDNSIQMGAVIKKHIRENVAFIELDYDKTKKLVFDNVLVHMEYCDESVPLVWHNVKIVNYKSEYVLQVFTEGVRRNRRDSFRVGVSTLARLRMLGDGPQEVIIRDVSLSGFSITDRKKELGLNIGDKLSVDFEDLGHVLDLTGRVVRIEEHEDMIIYGLELCNLCKDLSSYVSLKQRRKNK